MKTNLWPLSKICSPYFFILVTISRKSLRGKNFRQRVQHNGEIARGKRSKEQKTQLHGDGKEYSHRSRVIQCCSLQSIALIPRLHFSRERGSFAKIYLKLCILPTTALNISRFPGPGASLPCNRKISRSKTVRMHFNTSHVSAALGSIVSTWCKFSSGCWWVIVCKIYKLITEL